MLQFVEKARSYIAEMGKDELEEHRQGLIEGWLETCALVSHVILPSDSFCIASRRWRSASSLSTEDRTDTSAGKQATIGRRSTTVRSPMMES